MFNCLPVGSGSIPRPFDQNDHFAPRHLIASRNHTISGNQTGNLPKILLIVFPTFRVYSDELGAK